MLGVLRKKCCTILLLQSAREFEWDLPYYYKFQYGRHNYNFPYGPHCNKHTGLIISFVPYVGDRFHVVEIRHGDGDFAGSSSHAIEDVLPATNIEKKAAIIILLKYFFV